jgi:hypothetical protein
VSAGSAFRARLQAAGMSLSSTSLPVVSPEWGQFQYPVPPDARLIIDSGESWIEWETDWEDLDLPLSPVPGRCLWDFQALADATDESMLSFATRWGPLDEAVPESMEAVAQFRPIKRLLGSVMEQLNSISQAGGGTLTAPSDELFGWLPTYKNWSPVQLWMDTARELKAVLSVAAALQQHLPVAAADWDDMLWQVNDEEFDAMPTPASGVEEQRPFVSEHVGGWLRRGHVGVVPQWTEEGFSVTLSTTGEISLTTILAMELSATCHVASTNAVSAAGGTPR